MAVGLAFLLFGLLLYIANIKTRLATAESRLDKAVQDLERVEDAFKSLLVPR